MLIVSRSSSNEVEISATGTIRGDLETGFRYSHQTHKFAVISLISAALERDYQENKRAVQSPSDNNTIANQVAIAFLSGSFRQSTAPAE